ncbi:hypothetical protein M758_1G118600 [Ceratodon purpureus]|nr:hypothetical protein M758_1G118600 [Ceratodon purpureus]
MNMKGRHVPCKINDQKKNAIYDLPAFGLSPAVNRALQVFFTSVATILRVTPLANGRRWIFRHGPECPLGAVRVRIPVPVRMREWRWQ